MPHTFPVSVKLVELREMISTIKKNKSRMNISMLSRKSRLNIDQILPLVDACVILGLAQAHNGIIMLTKDGKKLSSSNAKEIIRERLPDVEPFKSVMKILRANDAISTKRLERILMEKGIAFYHDRDVNNMLLTELLMKWGVGSNLLLYKRKDDLWILNHSVKTP